MIIASCILLLLAYPACSVAYLAMIFSDNPEEPIIWEIMFVFGVLMYPLALVLFGIGVFQ